MVLLDALFSVLLGVFLIVLILMHSGSGTSLGGIGFSQGSHGGTHSVERNLTRLTLAVAIIFYVNGILLYHLMG